ncbi:MAG: extracellular solute-binding protein [Clostridiales bacterium]|nr:extracellular solute-binding protein [Clostridiales bacterium]
MRKARIAALALAGCVAFSGMTGLLVGCGDGAGGSSANKMTIWAPQEEQVNLPKMIDAFKEEYPDYKDVKFEYKVMSVDNSITQLQKDNKAAADVFLFPSGGITELTSAGLINPLNVNMTELNAMYTENAVESIMLDNKVYAIPVTLNTFIMYYNSDFYTETEVQSLDTMMAKDLADGVKNFSIVVNDSWYLSTFFLTQENAISAPTPSTIKCNYNNADGYKVGEYLIDLVNNDKFFPADGSGSDGNALKNKTLAALCSGTWSAKDIKGQLGDKYRAVPMPKVNIGGKECDMANFGDYKAYGVNSATKNPKLANLVAEWLGNATCQTMRYNTSGDAPTIKALLALESVQNDQAVMAALEQEKVCTVQPKTSKLTGYWDAVKAFGTELLNGDITKTNLQTKLNQMVTAIEG